MIVLNILADHFIPKCTLPRNLKRITNLSWTTQCPCDHRQGTWKPFTDGQREEGKSNVICLSSHSKSLARLGWGHRISDSMVSGQEKRHACNNLIRISWIFGLGFQNIICMNACTNMYRTVHAESRGSPGCWWGQGAKKQAFATTLQLQSQWRWQSVVVIAPCMRSHCASG